MGLSILLANRYRLRADRDGKELADHPGKSGAGTVLICARRGFARTAVAASRQASRSRAPAVCILRRRAARERGCSPLTRYGRPGAPCPTRTPAGHLLNIVAHRTLAPARAGDGSFWCYWYCCQGSSPRPVQKIGRRILSPPHFPAVNPAAASLRRETASQRKIVVAGRETNPCGAKQRIFFYFFHFTPCAAATQPPFGRMARPRRKGRQAAAYLPAAARRARRDGRAQVRRAPAAGTWIFSLLRPACEKRRTSIHRDQLPLLVPPEHARPILPAAGIGIFSPMPTGCGIPPILSAGTGTSALPRLAGPRGSAGFFLPRGGISRHFAC